ncbi:response regulator transcription factor [Streptomyces mirabilis]|uniref:response regulator transcription factor n=1 Tax=Streptomyces mirabilis TaxID=68239 RepID=UPI00352D3332
MGLVAEIVGELVGQVVDPEKDLSHREIEVVRLLAEGRSNRGIAEALYLSEARVKTHLVRVYRKLRVDRSGGGRVGGRAQGTARTHLTHKAFDAAEASSPHPRRPSRAGAERDGAVALGAGPGGHVGHRPPLVGAGVRRPDRDGGSVGGGLAAHL